MIRGFADAVGSSLTLTGGVAIGWAFHRTLWLGDLSLAAPASVAGFGGGAALVAAGRYLEGEPPETGDDTDEGADESEYDERFSPVDADQLGDGDGE